MSAIIDIVIVELRELSLVMNPMYFLNFDEIRHLTARQ